VKQASGQTSIQLLIPLLLVLFTAIAFAYMMPRLTTLQTFAFGGGIIFLIVCLASTEIALYLLIFSMLLSPEFIVGTTGGASLGRGVTLRVDDFVILIVGFSWLAKMAINKELGFFLETPLNKPIAYYIIACLLSTLLGTIFGKVQFKTGIFYVLKYFEYVLIYFMVANHLHEKKQVRSYLWALLITCVIVSIIGMAQIPEGGRVSAPFEGEGGEPNTFGGYLVFMMCITTGLFLTAVSPRAKVLYGLLILVFAVPLLYTQSRSSYLALIPATLSFVWLSEKRQWVLLTILFVAVALPFLAPKPAKERVAYTFFEEKDRGLEIGGVALDTSTTARIESWKNVARDWIKHPVFGYGVTGYAFVDAQYFRVLIETGALGFFAFSLLMIRIFRISRQKLKQASEPLDRGLTMGFVAGFVGLLFHGIGANTFIIVRIMEPFWFVTAMVMMLPDLETQKEEKAEGL